MKKGIAVSVIIIAVFMLGAWRLAQPGQDDKPAAGAARPPVPVTLATARRVDVPVRLQANGYVSSLNSVDVRPQVSNVITRVHIKEGQQVKAGDLLFSLDDRADRVNLSKAQAQMAKDAVSLADLERQLKRSRELVSKGFISQSAVDTVQAQVDAQRAAVTADRAAVEAARVALGYDQIRASSAGRAGAIAVYPGSLVQPSSAPLVTISQLDPIAITFALPEHELGALLAAQKAGGATVSAMVQGAGKPLPGRLSFIDNAVDAQTGTIKVKAVFANPERLLWPGQYVPISTVVRDIKDAIVIPQAAIITGAEGRSVYVAGAADSVQQRPVELLYSFGTEAVVGGVNAGEQVVVDGKQNLRPGAKIRIASDEPARKNRS